MKISNRFSIAVHILSLLVFAPAAHATSEWLAGSVNTNPVIIRRILGQLKKAGLVGVRAGSGGAYLVKAPGDINLLDVYRAVEVVAEQALFHVHEQPNPNCPVGANIQGVLNQTLFAAQAALENTLRQVTLAALHGDLHQEIARNAKQ